jgi:pSer/pThr/pTyr-binding forkhead associated (FHA) protein
MDRPYIEINTAAGSKQLILGREPISIGRHTENKLVLSDHMASRFHCVIEKAPDGYLLRDLGASNGTFVNGRKVGPRCSSRATSCASARPSSC